MIKRTIEVSTRGTVLRTRNRQLVISRDDEELGRVPFEDLGVLILAGDGCQISSGSLRRAASAGAVVVVCGEAHLPESILLPVASNSLHAERIRSQVELREPVRKRLWQRVVRAKIENQSLLLPKDSAAFRSLQRMAGDVRTGDVGNLEAQAGRAYWGNLFEPFDVVRDFRRRRDGVPPNGLLNYGYAIVRATIARALCAAGLHPALGIHHSNRYNAFCLADDLIEPFRPVVDAAVLELVAGDELEVCKETKQRLLEVLSDSVMIDGERSPVLVACQKSAQSLAACLTAAGSNAVEGSVSALEIAAGLSLPRLITIDSEESEPHDRNARLDESRGATS